ncbi:MAG: InlB B-repeat-containing protein, partial [Planctomycetota bacterium]
MGGPSGNYVFDSVVVPPCPGDAETLAYDPHDDIWYSGVRTLQFDGSVWTGEVYKYEMAQGSGGAWQLAFTYTHPSETSHRGLEYINEYLFLATTNGDSIQQFALDGTLVDTFTHAPFSQEVQGMGWGALEHFWVGAPAPIITEFGGGRIQAIEPPMPVIEANAPVPPIYVEQGCTLTGWEPDDPNFWTWDVNSWDANTHNIDADPCFFSAQDRLYYLDQIDAGQETDSPCVDLGSDLASVLGLDLFSTRIDAVGDVNQVDMGFHYWEALAHYLLTVTVVDGNGTVDPCGAVMVFESYLENVVDLTAYPDPNYRLKAWTGTDDDSSTALTNTVTVTADATVTVQFERIPEYTLSVTVIGGHGSVIVDPNQATYLEDTLVTLTAVPDPNYRVRVWTGTDDDSSTDPNNTVTITADANVTVEFEAIPTFHLTVTVPYGHGSVYPSSGDYLDGTPVTLTATPDEGYRVKQWTGTDDDSSTALTNTVTMDSDKTVTIEFDAPKSYHVPGQYSSISTLVSQTDDYGRYVVRDGDKVVVSVGTYSGGIDFDGRSIIITSEHPDDPCCIADTIIAGWGQRAFTFRGGEGPDAVITGFTIRNSTAQGSGWSYLGPADPHGRGGAIAALGAASPTIANLIIEDCQAMGWNGSNGYDATEAFPGAGGDANDGGNAYGGAMYFAGGSEPNILSCQITGCLAIGGNAGRGGNAYGADPCFAVGPNTFGLGYRGGDAGTGGSAYGGALYFGYGCRPTITNCTIEDCNTLPGAGNVGGNGGDANDGGWGGRGGDGGSGGFASFGGGICFDQSCEPVVIDTVISDCNADVNYTTYRYPGGSGGSGDVNRMPGMNGYNWASTLGGASFYGMHCDITLDNCIIMRNSAQDDGGAEHYAPYCSAAL